MEYQFKIRQQPEYGREAGLTKPYLEAFRFVCNIVLVSEEEEITQTLIGSVRAHKKYRENLFGNTTVQGYVFKDPVDGLPKIFFIFNNLFINTPGNYKFRCQLVDFTDSKLTLQTLETNVFKIHKLYEFVKGDTNNLLAKSFKSHLPKSLVVKANEKKNLEPPQRED
ncbi:hypothetical protein HDV06_006244 [Boothiomyces sp. JEL0866]|nr:hypothetical protein HDV06_006244 [Boothiomyces sp. JEL0866]